MEIVLVLVFWAGVGGLIGYAIGNDKGRGGEGFWLGFLLGFIGWIIVGVMSPTPEREAQRAGAIAAAVAHAGASKREGGRPCPWCAETIKPAARVCRYCGRDVEPLDILEITEASWQKVQDEFPSSHPIAMELLDALSTPPERPADWTRELCNRIEAGSVPEAAAARIPLDWSSAEPT